MRITLVVAMDEAGVIGRGGALPWHLPEDLKRFRRLTMGKPLVMGRRTHESIGRALPGRHNIVITSRADYRAEDCTVVGSFDEALEAAAPAGEVMVIGGAGVFAEALPRATRIHLTRVHARVEGDVWFPDPALAGWRVVEREPGPADAAPPCSFEVLER